MNLKKRVRDLLTAYDHDGLLELLSLDRRVVPMLNRLLFDREPLIAWRAVTALGWVAAEDPFVLEKVISRLFYTMNDDSGSIGWMAPPALGEICVGDPDLVEDFFPIIVSAVDNEVFRTGALWAVGRVAPVRPDLVEESGPVLNQRLGDPRAENRGHAAWAAGRVRAAETRAGLQRLTWDEKTFFLYQDGHLQELTVGRAAAEALAALS